MGEVTGKPLEWIPFKAAAKGWQVSRSSIAWAYWHGRVQMVRIEGLWLVYAPDMTTHFGDQREPIDIEPPEFSIHR